MCWLIMLGVSGYRGDPADLFRAHGLEAEVTHNPACDAMGATATRLAISDGHCACALYAGARQHAPADRARLASQYARKGWSQAKIDRALDARTAADQRQHDKRARANPFPDAVRDLVQHAGAVQLLAHDFNGSFDTPFEVTKRETVALADFLARDASFPEDTLLTIAL